jgi:enoyl-CoA hydratase/carnithine racemase
MGVLSVRHGTAIEIALDWPAVRNAVGPRECGELRSAFEMAAADSSVAVIVVSGTGTSFCAGGNLAEIMRLAAAEPSALRSTLYGEFQALFRTIRNSPVPILCAVDGPAIGFGCDLALAANVTFIGAQGWLAQGWIRAGLVPATGGTLYALRRAGEQALWRLVTAERVDGATAAAWGLGVDCDNARSAALEMAAAFAALPREPLRALLQLSRIRDDEAHLSAALDYQTEFLRSAEFALLASKLLRR